MQRREFLAAAGLTSAMLAAAQRNDQPGTESATDSQVPAEKVDLRDTPTDSAPGLFTAVQEQPGLKLTATGAPTDMFVIDAATRSTESQPRRAFFLHACFGGPRRI